MVEGRRRVETITTFFSNESSFELLLHAKMPSVVIKSKGGSTLATLKVDSSVREGSDEKEKGRKGAGKRFSPSRPFARWFLFCFFFSALFLLAPFSHQREHLLDPNLRQLDAPSSTLSPETNQKSIASRKAQESGRCFLSILLRFVSGASEHHRVFFFDLLHLLFFKKTHQNSFLSTHLSLPLGHRRRPQGRLRGRQAQVLPFEAALHASLTARGAQANRSRAGRQKAL